MQEVACTKCCYFRADHFHSRARGRFDVDKRARVKGDFGDPAQRKRLRMPLERVRIEQLLTQ